MSTVRVLSRNIASNWIGFAIHVAVTFFLTPFILHSLGDTRYGAWSLITSLTGYYGLLDLGFRSGLTLYLARYVALEDHKQLNCAASTGFIALTACGLAVLTVSFGLAAATPSVFDLTGEISTEVAWAIIINGAGMAVQFLFFTHSAVFTACQRYDLSNLIGVPTRLIGAVLTVVVLSHGGGLIELSLAQCATNTIDYLVRWRVARRLLPQLRLSYKGFSWRSCREFTSFGAWNVLIMGSARLISSTDAIVIGLFLPPAAIARFALASSLSSYFQQIFQPIGHVFFPAIVHADARGDATQTGNLYLQGSRLLATLSGAIAALAFVWSDDFYRLWIGEAYSASHMTSVSMLFRVLLIAAAVNAVQRVGYQVLLGKCHQKQLAGLFLSEGLANLSLTILLVPTMGLLGAAVGTLIPALVFQGCVQPFVVTRLLHISLITYYCNTLIRPLIVTVTALVTSVLLSGLMEVDAWTSFGLMCFTAAMLTFLVIVLFGVTTAERHSLFSRWRGPQRAQHEQLSLTSNS